MGNDCGVRTYLKSAINFANKNCIEIGTRLQNLRAEHGIYMAKFASAAIDAAIDQYEQEKKLFEKRE